MNSAINNMMDGGIKRGELLTFLGESTTLNFGEYKSNLVSTIASDKHNKGDNVLYISLENSEETQYG